MIEEVLLKQIKQFKSLNELLQKEQAVLLKSDAKALAQLVDEKANIVAVLNQLEENRLTLMDGKRLEDLEISDQALNALKEELRSEIEITERIQGTNAMLTLQGLNYSQTMIDGIMNLAKTNRSVYGKSGTKKDQQVRAAILNREM